MNFCVIYRKGSFEHKSEGYETLENDNGFSISLNLPQPLVAQLNQVGINKCAELLKTCRQNDFFWLHYNKHTNSFSFANDHFASNEILYTLSGEKIVITDSIGHLKSQKEDLAVDFERFGESLAYRLVNPPNSLFIDVFSVPIANLVTIDCPTGETSSIEYWNPLSDLQSPEMDYKDLVEEAQTGMINCLEQETENMSRMGVSLSGGVDSGGLLSILTETNGVSIPSFTMGAHGPSSFDLTSAKASAQFNKSPQKFVYPSFEDFAKLPRYCKTINQPQDGQVLLVNGLLFDEIKAAGIARVLFGFGTDNMLGCQKYSKLAYKLDHLSFSPETIQRIVHKLAALHPKFSKTQKIILTSKNWTERFLNVKAVNFWKELDYLKISNPFESFPTPILDEIFTDKSISAVDKLVYADWKAIHIYNRHGMVNKIGKPLGITGFNPAYTTLGGIPLLHTSDKQRKINNWGKQVFKDSIGQSMPEHLHNGISKSCVLPLKKWLTNPERLFKDYLLESPAMNKTYDVEKFFAEFDELPEAQLSTLRLISSSLWYDMHFDPKCEDRFMAAFSKALAK